MHHIVLLVLICTTIQNNFHERNIYYSERDNVCIYGERADSIKLELNLDGLQTRKYLTTGATACDEWSHYYFNKVIPG